MTNFLLVSVFTFLIGTVCENLHKKKQEQITVWKCFKFENQETMPH